LAANLSDLLVSPVLSVLNYILCTLMAVSKLLMFAKKLLISC
jgi:hypothetical protein